MLQAETLTGDIRDFLLGHLRDMQKPWPQMSEREQGAKIAACNRAAENLVRGAVAIVAHQGFPHIHVDVGKWTVKEGVKPEVVARATVDNITHLAEHANGTAILVLAEANEFFGQRQDAKPEPDEPELPIEAGEPDTDFGLSEPDEPPHDPETGEIVIEAAPEAARGVEGKPVPLTEAERAAGAVYAVEGPDGDRIVFGPDGELITEAEIAAAAGEAKPEDFGAVPDDAPSADASPDPSDPGEIPGFLRRDKGKKPPEQDEAA